MTAAPDAAQPDGAARREALVERIASYLDVPITAAGLLLVVVVVADNLTSTASPWKPVWTAAAWFLWLLFAVEFAIRWAVAPSRSRFFRANWWQLAFLAVPFLRFLRTFARAARFARIASTSVRTSRTAGRTFLGRVGALTGVALAMVLVCSEILFEYGPPGLDYATALHDVAIAAISGDALDRPGAVAAVLDVVLALHSATIFAALAGAIGAFLLERRAEVDGPVVATLDTND